FTRERFVYEGETLEDALSTGSARRRALDAALAEIDAGANQPSIEWRRQFSLLLGLERLLSEEEPHLVDALSGTLTALLAEAQRNGNGNAAAAAAAAAAAESASLVDEDEDEDEGDELELDDDLRDDAEEGDAEEDEDDDEDVEDIEDVEDAEDVEDVEDVE